MDDELIYPLRDENKVTEELQHFLIHHHLTLGGVTCFDCESLAMAAAIADNWGLPFSSRETVRYCRNKYVCKQRWYTYGVPCPRVRKINCLEDIAAFMGETESSVILKPLSGSGSELIFRCDNYAEAIDAYPVMMAGLKSRSGNRMYHLSDNQNQMAVLCEEYIEGEEFSCDILLKADEAKILRLAKKYFPDKGPIGTTQAYEIPVELPAGTDLSAFMAYVSAAVKAVDLTDGLCMLDFIIRNGRPYFIEISPRPGGDCLPPLIEESCGFDMIAAALDYAEGLWLMIPPHDTWDHLVGVRFHAEHSGRLQAIRPHLDGYEKRVRSMVWLKQPGDPIRVPPEDYASWLLGYIIFEPAADQPIHQQIIGLKKQITVDIL